MKLNKAGVTLCVIYAVFAALLFILALNADVKGRVVFMQIAFFLFLIWTGLLDLIVKYCPFLDHVFLHLPLSLLLVYFVGWAISSANAAILRLFDKPAPVPSSDDPYGIPKK